MSVSEEEVRESNRLSSLQQYNNGSESGIYL